MLHIILLLLAGFVAGAVNAAAAGGKLLIFPALVAAGLSPITANITANLVMGGGTLAAAWQYRHQLHRVPKRYFLLLVPCFMGAVVGMVLLRHTSGSTFEKLVPWLITVAVVLFGLQPWLSKYLDRPLRHRPRLAMPLVGLLLLVTAVYGGYFGAGFGLIFMALLAFTKLKNVYQLSALRNLMGGCVELFAVSYFAVVGGIAWRAGLIAMVGGIAGGVFGARWALKTPQTIIHSLIVVIGVLLAILTFAHAYALL